MEKKMIRTHGGIELRAAVHQTGRYIMSFRQGAHKKISAKLELAGIPPSRTKPPAATVTRSLPHGGHFILPKLGFAVIDPHAAMEDGLFELARQEDDILMLTPEGTVKLASASSDYVRGWRDATAAFADSVLAADQPAEARIAAAAVSPAADFTSALMVTGVTASRLSGAGIRIGILDTGLDLDHPDFAGRDIISENLVGDGMPFHDGHGHGTHCAGLAGGPLSPAQGARYGVAYESSLYIARVLDNEGEIGVDGTIIQGIEHAVRKGCAVISISIEKRWQPGQLAFDSQYEDAISRATEMGSLVVVAAGNEGSAVGAPGNSPSALTVAAVDRSLTTASFSNRIVSSAPEIKGPDLAAPGVGMRSAWLTCAGSYKSDSGTSQATACVAGIAALWAQSDENLRGTALKSAILDKLRSLAGAAARRGEIGAGLAQAPHPSS